MVFKELARGEERADEGRSHCYGGVARFGLVWRSAREGEMGLGEARGENNFGMRDFWVLGRCAAGVKVGGVGERCGVPLGRPLRECGEA